MDTRTQDRLKELITVLARNPNLHNLASAIENGPPIQLPSSTDPPPYPFAEVDDDDEEDENNSADDARTPTTMLNIDASTHVVGSNNTITTNAPHALAQTVFTVLRQVSQAPVAIVNGRAMGGPVTSSSQNLKVQINCNVDVRGDGNAIGALTIKKPEGASPEPGAGQGQGTAQGASAGQDIGQVAAQGAGAGPVPRPSMTANPSASAITFARRAAGVTENIGNKRTADEELEGSAATRAKTSN